MCTIPSRGRYFLSEFVPSTRTSTRILRRLVQYLRIRSRGCFLQAQSSIPIKVQHTQEDQSGTHLVLARLRRRSFVFSAGIPMLVCSMDTSSSCSTFCRRSVVRCSYALLFLWIPSHSDGGKHAGSKSNDQSC